MTTPASTSAGAGDPSRYLPALLLLFAGSGASALIYEIVWYQQLQLAIGSTAVSLGVLLATYMGGLSLGSWLLPRYLSGKRASMHPLRAYAYIEFGVAILGAALLVIIPVIDKLYVAGAQSGAPGMVLRALFCAVALLPPTILMGASLPAIARWADSSPRGASWWGLFYGINIAGAVAGSLMAGFWLLRLYDIYVGTAAAVGLNLVVGGLSLYFASRVPATVEAEAGAPVADANIPAGEDDRLSRWLTLIAIAVSGVVSMGSQVVWARILGLMLGGTVYVFSIILAVFLTGLGIGASVGSSLGRKMEPRILLGWSQTLAAVGLGWTAWQFSSSLPFWPMNPLANTPVSAIMQTDLIRVLWAILPPTLFWGAAVPLAFAAVAKTSKDPARSVGSVYAANTLGCIVGALAVSLFLMPVLGTHKTEQILLALSGLSAIIAFAPVVLAPKATWKPWAGVVAGAVAVCLLVPFLKPVPPELIAYGRRTAAWLGQFEVLESHEGKSSSVAITRWTEGGANTIQFHVSGKVEASDDPRDMSLQRMLGFVPAMFMEPKSVLIVGFGAGVTAGTFTTFPSVERIVICEIEPIIPPMTTKWFGQYNHQVIKNPKTTVHYDDARHYILTTKEKFDLITSDPIHPFVKGLASLYSLEYFEALRDHLNPGGVVTQWIPLYESDMATVKSEIASFMQAFPYAEIFANATDGGEGYDLVLIGHNTPFDVDLLAANARLARPQNMQMAADMQASGLGDFVSLYNRYAGDKVGLAPWLRGAQINRDKDLRLQYLAGFALNRNEQTPINQAIRAHMTPPVGLRVTNIREAVGAASTYPPGL